MENLLCEKGKAQGS